MPTADKIAGFRERAKAKGASDAEIEAFIAKKTAEESAKSKLADVLGGGNRGARSKAIPVAPEDTHLGSFIAGIGKSAKDTGVGLTQLGALATGNEDLLAKTQEYEEATRANEKERFGDSNYAMTAGDITGSLLQSLIPASKLGAAGRAAVAARGPVVNALARTGAGLAGGALGGAATPLTASEEAAGNRAENAFVGGLLGGAVSGVSYPLQALRRGISNLGQRVDPREALLDFAKQTKGVEPGTDVGDIVRELKTRGKWYERSVKNEANKLYGLEKDATLPMVSLAKVSASVEDDLNELGGMISGVRGMDDIQDILRGKRDASGIGIHPTGEQKAVPLANFNEVRDILRVLKDKQFSASSLDDKLRYSNQIKTLQGHLDEWAASSPQARKAMENAQKADEFYATKMGPLLNKNEVGANWRKKGYSEDMLRKLTMGKNSGLEFEQLADLIPGMRPGMEKLALIDALQPGTRTNHPLIRNTTLREAVFPNPEQRKFLDVVGEQMGANATSTRRNIDANLEFLRGKGSIVQALRGLAAKQMQNLTGSNEMYKYGFQPRLPKGAEAAKYGLGSTLLGRGIGSFNELEEDE